MDLQTKIKTTAMDLATSPQVSLPATGVAWTIGQVTAEQWLTYLSICAVIIQILISLPKLYKSYQLKNFKRRVKNERRKK